MYRPCSEDPYAMVAIHHFHAGIAVGVNWVIGESNFIPFTSGIDDIIWNIRSCIKWKLKIHLEAKSLVQHTRLHKSLKLVLIKVQFWTGFAAISRKIILEKTRLQIRIQHLKVLLF